jgi:hypothetical protein
VYAGIDQLAVRENFAASSVCDFRDASRSWFYAWRSSQESLREQQDQELTPIIYDVFWRHKRRYGARRISEELVSRGIACGVARVARLLKTPGILAIQPKSYRPKTTVSRHRLGFNQNLLSGRKAPTGINEVWVADMQLRPPTDQGGSRPKAVGMRPPSRWRLVIHRDGLRIWQC